MKWKVSFRTEFKVVVAVIVLLSLIAFTEKKQAGNVCRDIAIDLANHHENHYLDEADILRLVEKSNPGIRGASFSRIDFKSIENKLEYDRHIEDAQTFQDLKGNLVVRVALRRPVARIVQENAPDAYVAEDGTIMAVSDKYTSRVVLISGPYAERLARAQRIQAVPGGETLLAMIEFIRENEFWNAQIAQIDMAADGKIVILPQITGQLVEFGLPDNYEEKLRKLMIFYKEILPQRGWTRYERVNLEYNGQIIAE
jgi:cell division protein FtsQ